MVIKLKPWSWIVTCLMIFLVGITLLFLLCRPSFLQGKFFMGGMLAKPAYHTNNVVDAALSESTFLDEIYHRPSKKIVLESPYAGEPYDQLGEQSFPSPQDVCFAYFEILREASNMLPDYGGGCGSIGNGTLPYPYAYGLLSEEAREKQSLKQFERSFKGTGHITLLQLIPMTNDRIFAEIESIEGNTEDPDLSLFTYHYAVISTVKESTSWKISDIQYFSEPFLCAPYHLWFYRAEDFVKIIYIENMKIINDILSVEQYGNITYIYAVGNHETYRLDFVTLTNGYQLLIQENVKTGDSWVPTDVLDEKWRNYKL